MSINSTQQRLTNFPNKNLNSDFEVESFWGKLKFDKDEILVCSMYRPPDADVEYFDEILDQIESSLEHCSKQVILGDLNHDYVMDEDLYKNPVNSIENYCFPVISSRALAKTQNLGC